MSYRIIAAATAALLLTPGMGAAAGQGDAVSGALGAEPYEVAQGYDPMRPSRPAPADPDRPPPNPELGDLPDAPGAEETFYMCSACHSIALVKQQRLTDARWDYLWTWMIEEQGMADPGEELREVILGYLKKYYSAER